MKRFNYILFLLLLTFVFVSCSEKANPVEVTNHGTNTLSKVNLVEYTFELDLSDPANDIPAYTDCPTGVPMILYGVLNVYIRELTTPSGNLIITGWSDYKYDDITLVNSDTGEIWHLFKAQNHFGEIYKHNGFYVVHYEWLEVFENEDGEKLRVQVAGHMRLGPDGIEIFREIYNCS